MSVYKDKKRGTWTVYYRCKDWQGNTKQITKRGFKTKKAGLEWEMESRRVSEESLDMTLKSFVEKIYLEEIKPRIKLSTYKTKENIINTHILPYLGNFKLKDLTPAIVIKWQGTLLSIKQKSSGTSFSKSYLKTIHNQLVAILNYAVRFYGLGKNVAMQVGNMGSDRGIEMKFWTLEEYRKFSEVMKDTPIFYYAFQILYWCGLREGELLALSLDDINFEKKTITVNKTFMRHEGEDIFTSPKTPQSIRTVSVPNFLIEELQDYVNLYFNRTPAKRLFPISKSNLTRQIQIGAQKAGIQRIRVHDLRHSHVSLLINKGVTALAIAKRVGHSSIDITYRYAHLFPNAQQSIANDLDQMNGKED